MTLHSLAALHGVATSYDDWRGRRVPVDDDVVVEVLAALGVPAASEEEVAHALSAAHDATDPVVVLRGPGTALLDGPATEVVLEDGTTRPVEGAPEGSHWRVQLPDLPLGWHRVGECVVVRVPERVPVPEGRHWGWQVQLYALRSRGSWGVGDYVDLRTVCEAAAADGAGAVLVNPLHAELPGPHQQASPYSPSSRLFRSALALRVTDVPEAAGVTLAPPDLDPSRVDRDTAWAAKRAALQLLWPRHRADALAAFRAERGQPLEDFALFCALADLHGVPWQDWPADLHRPTAALHAEHAEQVAFWCWVQLLVDEQLTGIGEGLAVGVLHDLAVGVDAGGADAWAMQDVLALGTSVGAPPDALAQLGQDWGLPPWRPQALREAGYAPYAELVRGVLRHAGGIRVDHVMGLSRLWWVPPGRTARDGTYVSYRLDELLGVLALEAHRAGAVVVGEDLGTVELRVREALDRTGVLGSDVLWFQTTHDGWFLPPHEWRRDALASVTTHDLPTAAGFLAGEHVRVRAELGQLGVPLEEELARVTRERELLEGMLRHQGFVHDDSDLVLALHRALVASPARLVLAQYGDAVGDLRQPNLPGTVDEYPNWRLPVADAAGRALGLEELLAHPGVRRLTSVLQGVR